MFVASSDNHNEKLSDLQMRSESLNELRKSAKVLIRPFSGRHILFVGLEMGQAACGRVESCF